MTELAKQAWDRLKLSLSTPGLQALARALEADDPLLTQGPMQPRGNLFGGGDPVAYALAMGDGIVGWDLLVEAWAEHLRQADGGYQPGELASWAFLAWWDCNPRDMVRVELALLVAVELDRRLRRPLNVSVC